MRKQHLWNAIVFRDGVDVELITFLHSRTQKRLFQMQILFLQTMYPNVTLLPFCSKNNIWSSIICSTKCISCITFISQNRRKCDIAYAFNFSIDKFGFCKSKRYFVFFCLFWARLFLMRDCVFLTATRHYKIHYCVLKNNSYQCQICHRIWKNIVDNIKSKK
jgi:hypothetical protein